MKIPTELLYSRDHEWIRVEGQKAWIGITDYAQHHLGDIVFVELPDTDTEVEVGGPLAVIESVKAVSSVYSSVSGMVVEANEELEEAPEKLNEDPYGSWVAVIEIKNPDELKNLLNAADYEQLCQEEE